MATIYFYWQVLFKQFRSVRVHASELRPLKTKFYNLQQTLFLTGDIIMGSLGFIIMWIGYGSCFQATLLQALAHTIIALTIWLDFTLLGDGIQ